MLCLHIRFLLLFWSSFLILQGYSLATTLELRDDCQGAAWQATPSAWVSNNVDGELNSWWQDVSSGSHRSFATELGKGFGAQPTGFECGIDEYSTCVTPGCAEYQSASDPSWSYLALVSVVNLDTFFNSLYARMTNGQVDYLGLTENVLLNFFPLPNPNFPLGSVAFWIQAILTALFALPAIFFGIGATAKVATVTVGAFTDAGVNELSSLLAPNAIASQLSEIANIATLNTFTETVGSASRQSIESWANTTLSGKADPLGKTILDYMANGSFVAGNLPPVSDIENFYKTQMVSRTINYQWLNQMIFVMCSYTTNQDDNSGPAQSRYYSTADGSVCYLYLYKNRGKLTGNLDKPKGLDNLNGTSFGIWGSNITEASVRAYQVAKFNYSQDIANNRIIESVSSNGNLTPFTDGPAWEGTWTIPVCHTGNHNWNTQYGDTTSSYGSLPCCCGPNCNETATFIQAANMTGFQTLLHGCQSQLANTEIEFSTVDYGFNEKKGGVHLGPLGLGPIIGIAIAGGAVIVGIILCCCCC